ncbi:beta-glucosidase [Vibrio crassostreae]|uniref:glycoside hydrolase family 3 protein n=1 Tax=Vibrio crassostreae TaxID=246167 RepID=UPI001052B728|nr:glycoside hydrolase family 3 protein [Vibrio crassostreae]TCT40810.1 beta-glucosidase [Vibrio crassostreae]TCV64633.1 beta-glucosidase [Vibrio crassostreae]
MNTVEILEAQKQLAPISRQAATEGIVLLKNSDSILPLQASDTVSLFGRCQIDTYRSGTGSGGAVNVPYSVNALQGLYENPNINLNLSLVEVYQRWVKDNPFNDGGGGWAAEPWFQDEMPLSASVVMDAAAKSNKAVIFIGRTAGEDQDNAQQQGSYNLTALEMQMLEKVTEHFDDVIVILNVTNIIDMSWVSSLKDARSIKAILYSWAAGMEGGHALADVLSGDVSPSGRLTDTIAHSLSDYPSSASFGNKERNLYQEDIYVGYRYFETFNPKAVQFEFGFGLSYTKFSNKLNTLTILGSGSEQELVFDIEVKNIGEKYSGKEVVQLYVESPQGQLGKPSRALTGFTKTPTLAPDETARVKVSFLLSSLASFDDSGKTGHLNSYVLEAGEYQFYLGGNVRQARLVDESITVDELIVVEQLTEALAPVTAFKRLVPKEIGQNGVYSCDYESVPLRSVDLSERILTELPASIPFSDDKGIKLLDVKQGQADIEAFVSQMTVQQLATIVRGEGMCSPKVTPGTAAAFGGVSPSLFDLGIPIVAAADGPSGIRMDSGHKASQVPIGTLLGCTWNTELNEQLFHLVGNEMQANHIDTLLGPGINIHRHPLNGRNFEYFSEDPLLTGAMAASQVSGLRSAGVSGTIKHLVANDQETGRFDVDSVVSQRALREIHLRPFEIAVRQGQASSIMTAYNPINGHWAASNYDLNTTILRKEWGYKGIVMTDWWAKMNDPIKGGSESRSYTSFMLRSQNDLYMVVEHDGAESNASNDDTLQALETGTLSLGELQRSAINICRFIMESPAMDRPLVAFDPIKSFDSTKNSDRHQDKTDGDFYQLTTEQRVTVLPLNTQENRSIVLEVKQAGVYRCAGIVNYDSGTLAQSACSLSLNNVYAMSLSVNGTNGETVSVEGLSVKLDKGFYSLDIEFIKLGLELEQLVFSFMPE